jgi:hypothetical protein
MFSASFSLTQDFDNAYYTLPGKEDQWAIAKCLADLLASDHKAPGYIIKSGSGNHR